MQTANCNHATSFYVTTWYRRRDFEPSSDPLQIYRSQQRLPIPSLLAAYWPPWSPATRLTHAARMFSSAAGPRSKTASRLAIFGARRSLSRGMSAPTIDPTKQTCKRIGRAWAEGPSTERRNRPRSTRRRRSPTGRAGSGPVRGTRFISSSTSMFRVCRVGLGLLHALLGKHWHELHLGRLAKLPVSHLLSHQ
jgi:hypothetical protein